MGVRGVPAGWRFLFSGKVRDIYKVDDKTLAFVATNRVSAFDWVLPNPIADKGKILTQFSKFWFKKTKDLCPNHWLENEESQLPQELWPRATLVRKVKVYPFEFVVRRYLAGSLWKAYNKNNLKFEISNFQLPEGLSFGDPIPNGPILTPTTKEKNPGKHDEDVSWETVIGSLTKEKAGLIKKKALEIFSFAHDYLKQRGIILADTKFEFGEIDGKILLADELLTPDSSRFWWTKDYALRNETSDMAPLDKQVVRNYLERDLKWDRKPPVPSLPQEIINKTREVYIQVFRAATGKDPIL